MRKKLLYLLVIAGMLWGAPVYQVAYAADGPPVVAEKPEGIDVGSIKADRMTLRERRALGLTVGNVRRIMLDLREKGTLADDPAAASMQVATALMEENADTYSQLSPQFDWDSFLAFVEKIVELVMKIIGLFSYDVPTYIDSIAASGGPPAVVYHLVA